MKLFRILFGLVFVVAPWLFVAVFALCFASTVKIGAAVAAFCVFAAAIGWNELGEYDKVR